MLATSRRRLSCVAEWLVPLEGLPLPGPEASPVSTTGARAAARPAGAGRGRAGGRPRSARRGADLPPRRWPAAGDRAGRRPGGGR
ncbi:MAG: hypothetical protein U0470_13230 [Anaerolineae bacterium]